MRPPDVCRFDDAENPVLLDKILTELGAEARPWSFKTDCCGGSLTIYKTPIVTKMVDKLMAMAREAGANCLVTACPVCTANLDMRASGGRRTPRLLLYGTGGPGDGAGGAGRVVPAAPHGSAAAAPGAELL